MKTRPEFVPHLCASVFICGYSGFAVAQDKKPADKPSPPPAVGYAVPLFPEAGKKIKLTLRGKNLDTATAVVASDPAVKVKFLAAKKAALPNNAPKERLGDTEIEIEIELPKGVKPGVTLTATGPGGSSAAYTLAVPGDPSAAAEKEPNDGFAQAQPLAVPGAMVGTVGRERDVDVFRIAGKAGDRLRVEVAAARHGGPLDAMLTLHDAAGRLIDTADDSDGSADPVLTVTLPRDGDYFLCLLDAHDLGGPTHGYRLTVTRADR